MRTTDCLKCNFPRDEPKGARVCRKCGRVEGQAKGAAHRDVYDPLAEFLVDDPPVVLLSGNTLGKTETPMPYIEVPAASTSATSNRGHSPMGGSRAKQFMNCSGSTALIQQLGIDPEETEYSREGTQAHSLAAFCLEEGADAEFALSLDRADRVLVGVSQYPLVNPDDAPYVQAYIDYVRSRPGRKAIEKAFHRPELHEKYWGMIDAEIVPVLDNGFVLEIVDFKFGAGVYVPVQRNEQMLYYAAGVIMEDESFFPDDGVVRLTIAQPRISWVDDPIRSWDTTVGEIKRWMHAELLPAMNLRVQDMTLHLGDWCQFCPAKLVCPAMTHLYKRFSFAAEDPLAMSDEALGTEFSLVEIVKMRVRAVEKEVLRRLMDGGTVPLTQLERGKTDRVWKENVTVSNGEQTAEVNLYDAAATRWGQDAYETKFKSPAQIEKLPGGKEFVAEWAYQPEGALKAGLAGKGKPAVVLAPPEERYAGAAAALFANKVG